MEKNQFELVLQTISTGLVGKIMSDSELSEDLAMEKLYSSELYSALEREETKVWHYSVHMLYELFIQEIADGKLSFTE